MNTTLFLSIIFFLVIIVFALGLLVIIRQHRGSDIKKKVNDDSEDFYWDKKAL